MDSPRMILEVEHISPFNIQISKSQTKSVLIRWCANSYSVVF